MDNSKRNKAFKNIKRSKQIKVIYKKYNPILKRNDWMAVWVDKNKVFDLLRIR